MRLIMEDLDILLLFIRFCVRCAARGYLNLTSQQLIQLCEECLVMAEYSHDCSAQAMVNIGLGEVCRKTEKYTEAIAYLERALAVAVQINDTYNEVYAYGELGYVYIPLGKPRQGISCMEKCLAIAIKTGRRSLEGDAYGYLGSIYYCLYEEQTAIKYFEKELAISQELNDKVREGYACYHLGKTYWSVDMHEEAKKWYKKCLIPLMSDKQVEDKVYGCLSLIYHHSGKYDKAIRYYEKLLHLVKDKNDDKREARVYSNLGEVYKSLGKVDEAKECYTKQLVLAEIMDCKEELLNAHFKLGDIYQTLGENDEAIKYFTKQLVLAETMDYKGELLEAHWRLGEIYHFKRKYFDAMKHYEKLLTISITTEDKKVQGFAYLCLGACSQSASDFHKAIEYCKESLNIALETKNKYSEIKAYMQMGCTYLSLGKCEEAIGYGEKALTIAEEINDKKSRGRICGQLGMAFDSFGKYDEALKYSLESLRINRETGKKKYELVSHENLALIYTHFGKFHESLQCYEKVLNLQIETGLTEDLQITYSDMGSVYHRVGNYENALKYFEMSLSVCQQKGRRVDEANAYANMSMIYQELEKYQKAFDCSKKALTIAKEIGCKIEEVESLTILGHGHLKQNKYNAASKSFERMLVIAKEIDSVKLVPIAYLNLARICLKCMEYENALDYSKKALVIAVSSGDKKAELSTNQMLGWLYYLTSGCDEMRIKQCKKHLEQSLQCCEWIFDQLPNDRDDCKVTIMDTFIQTYKILTNVLLETGEIHKALIVSDRGRARGLSDLMELKYKEVPRYGKNVIQKYDEVDTMLQNGKNEFCVLYFALQFDVVANWVLAHKKTLVLHVAQGFAHTPLPTSERISEVVLAAYDDMNVRNCQSCEDRSLLDHLPEAVHLVKSHDRFVRVEGQKEGQRKLPPDQNKRRVQEVAPNEKKNVEVNKNPLEMVYTDLIAPVMQYLTHEDVVIVPDGPLYMVPFAALRDPETGLFLSEMKRIRLAPSLATLKSLQECPANYHSKTGALVVGDPNSGTVMFQGDETTFSPLPKAQHEAKIIGNILGVEPLIGAQATKDVVKQRLHEGVAVIHIAAHGCANKGEIVLAPRALTGGRKIPEEEDYMLTMQEVQETGVKAQLVVLSCCHSGRGEIRAEGIVGISRGFLAAGARAVVASLWAIDDEATLVFMVSFYTCLKMGQSASKSLQQAMKDVRDVYEETRHWAPFFLIGDDVTIDL